jgi:ubiquinone/menaquinone biosynthesis methyltransferase
MPPRPEGASLPSPRELAAQDLARILADPARKQGFVTPMFEHIAPRYDAFTRLFSFGRDARWKGTLLAWFDRVAPARCEVVDLACGTGDLALGAMARRPGGSALGVDAARAMIERATARADGSGAGHCRFVVGDITQLAVADGSVDVVLAGYAFRNVPRHADALAEAARILRPGGHLLALDFYRPAGALWCRVFLRYLAIAGGVVGWWWHRAPVMYAYIASSIRQFVTGDEFARALGAAGFHVESTRSYLGGGVMLHHAVRGDGGAPSGP